ncbi:MAG: hypothetical protein KKH41_03220 [Candidatus Thermoplasmatota archaeon]|nr:hypothetical protein [Euryarchaeota archaeon]MBU4071667.1 hypothetical protein [Candidatus Thermoplasmatota archaeon]MBU4144135.1 hypothetical protein [Candidatus Thermoplasmatota archaeon]MBU4591576.1 hypothetical protein [Candidatus Thermoplasmatota archaeon]
MSRKKRIELYLDSQKVILDSKNPYYSTSAGKTDVTRWHPRHDDCYIVKEGVFGFTETEKKFLSQLEQLAISEGRELKIYDTKNFWHGIRAYFRGVEQTPAIVLGRKRFTKDIYETEWSSGFENKQKYELTMDAERLRNGLVFILIGIGVGLIAVILRTSRLFCFSAILTVVLIAIGSLVIFGNVLDKFHDWAN